MEKDTTLTPEALSLITHELRSPLTSVRGYICAAKDSDNDADRNKYLDIAASEAERAALLVEDIMALAKLYSSEYSIKEERFDANELIRLSLIEKLPAIEAKNITPEILFENEVEFVRADKKLISHVFINLIDNAVKYGKENGSLVITVKKLGGKVRFTFKDNGRGISPEALPHIWDDFFQTDCSTGYSGHGLGLPFVKRALLLHNEEIQVSSVESKGTTFSFELSQD